MKLKIILSFLFFLSGFLVRAQLPDAFISGHDVRLRKEPSLSGEILFMMEHGTPAVILEKSKSTTTVNGVTDHWYKITIPDSLVDAAPSLKGKMIGWVFGQFLVTDSVFHSDDYRKKVYEDSQGSLPALKTIKSYSWTNCPWDEQYEYSICGMWYSDDIISIGAMNPSRYETYQVINAKELSPAAYQITTRLLYSEYGDSYNYDKPPMNKIPVPSRILTLQMNVLGAYDSLEFVGFPGHDTLKKYCSHYNKVYNSSMPVVFKVTQDRTPFFSMRYYTRLDHYEQILDSALGLAQKGDLFFHGDNQGFLLKPSEYAKMKPRFWHMLWPYPIEFTFDDYCFVPGSGLTTKVAPDEVAAFVDKKYLEHYPKWTPVKDIKFYQDTEKGRRTIIVGNGYLRINEPDGGTRLKIMEMGQFIYPDYTTFFVQNPAFDITWDPKRNFHQAKSTGNKSTELFSWNSVTGVLKSNFYFGDVVEKEVEWIKE